MKKDNNFIWLLPLYFFIFLAIFLSAKFIFIFFFRASYEPDFMFKLTPFHLLSGFNNLQLLFLSLITVIFATYLHLKATKRNLTYSFIPTVAMLSGIGLSIGSDISLSNIVNFAILLFLLIVAIIDQKHILLLPEIISVEKEAQKGIVQANPKPILPRIRVRFSAKPKPRHVSYPVASPLFSLSKPSKKAPTGIKMDEYVEFKEVETTTPQFKRTPATRKKIMDERPVPQDKQPEQPKTPTNDDIQYSEDMLEKIEKRMEKLTTLEDEIEQKRLDLAKKEEELRERSVAPTAEPILSKSTPVGKTSSEEKREDITYLDMLEEIPDPAAIIQRGEFKEVSQTFADLLGYKTEEIIGKRFLDFVVPESFSSTEKYYLHRLKGKSISGVEIMFLTKNDHKIAVEFITKPTMLNGEKIEIMIFKKVR